MSGEFSADKAFLIPGLCSKFTKRKGAEDQTNYTITTT